MSTSTATAPGVSSQPIRFVVRRGFEPVVPHDESLQSICLFDESSDLLFETLVTAGRAHETPEQFRQRQFCPDEPGVHVVISYQEVPGRVVWRVWPSDTDPRVPIAAAQDLVRAYLEAHPGERLHGFIGDLAFDVPLDFDY